jgi:hypothetical protein
VGDLAFHDRQRLSGRCAVVLRGPQELQPGSNRCERIAQLVCEHRQKLVFAPICFLERGFRSRLFDRRPRALGCFFDDRDLVPGPVVPLSPMHTENRHCVALFD